MLQTPVMAQAEALLGERFGQQLQRYVPLASVTSMGIGGPAAWFLAVHTEAELVQALRAAWMGQVPWCVMGDGSNLVGSDVGYAGLLIQNRIHAFAAVNGSVTVGAGDHLTEVVLQLDRLGLSGLEKMAGIPGTIGGAVYGCAGAYGQEMKDHICEVRFYDAAAGRFNHLGTEECEFSYRDSIFKRHRNWVITQVVLDLQPGDPQTLLKTSQDLVELRQRKFPLDLKCPGCYFKNIRVDHIEPRGRREAFLAQVDPKQIMYGKVAAGYLLEAVGAKGMRVGGVRVRPDHGNLVVNDSGGTAADLRTLVATLKELVHQRFGVELQEEVQYLGF